MSCSYRWFVLAVAIPFVGACVYSDSDSDPSVNPGEIDFVTEIKPILMNQCLPCHHSGTALGGFNLETESVLCAQESMGLLSSQGALSGVVSGSLFLRLTQSDLKKI